MDIPPNDPRFRLSRRFARQRDFAATSSPLAARLCDLWAKWLADQDDPLAAWLLEAAEGRATFEVPMLLLAGLHREVLTNAPAAAMLARFFPTVGGDCPLDDDRLAPALRTAIQGGKERLTTFIQSATVQTNETSRGLCWLLPASWPGWPAVHLVDLGASAGLNLVADQRCYQLTDPEQTNAPLLFGTGDPAEAFIVECEGAPCPAPPYPPPSILSRTGCDLAPFVLDSAEAEKTLAAFVWGDQTRRLTMLRRGIDALHRANQGPAPVHLHAADLPTDLAPFLASHCRWPDQAPLILANTYLSPYLTDKGASLRSIIGPWAKAQSRPVLWIQWEPLETGEQPPHLGWLAWTVDLWLPDRHCRWHLAWVHPHGGRLVWLPGATQWADFWRINAA